MILKHNIWKTLLHVIELFFFIVQKPNTNVVTIVKSPVIVIYTCTSSACLPGVKQKVEYPKHIIFAEV